MQETAVPSFLVYVITLTVKNICFISSFNLSGFDFQPFVNFIHLYLLCSMWKKKMVHVKLTNMWKIWVLITSFMHNIGLRTVVACLHVSNIIPFSLTTSFWNMSILDWSSAPFLIKMDFLEQVWAECWQLSLNYGGMIRRNSFPNTCPLLFATFLDMTWAKYS